MELGSKTNKHLKREKSSWSCGGFLFTSDKIFCGVDVRQACSTLIPLTVWPCCGDWCNVCFSWNTRVLPERDVQMGAFLSNLRRWMVSLSLSLLQSSASMISKATSSTKLMPIQKKVNKPLIPLLVLFACLLNTIFIRWKRHILWKIHNRINNPRPHHYKSDLISAAAISKELSVCLQVVAGWRDLLTRVWRCTNSSRSRSEGRRHERRKKEAWSARFRHEVVTKVIF